jgi:hypothetical protein
MALDASEILGTPQLAGVKVNRRGMGAAVVRSVGLMSGGTPAVSLNARRHPNTTAQSAKGSDTPSIGRIAFLAVTADEIVLIDVKSRIVTTYLASVIARAPRDEVATIELEGGGLYSMPLTVRFVDGDSWALEVPKPYRRDARRVAQAFGA